MRVRRYGWRILLFIENQSSRFFNRGESPFYFLGALSFFFFWLVLLSGACLLIFYRLNIDGAYDSIQYLTEEQPYFGGFIRSLHRYSADGLMITMVLHGLRVFLAGQFRHARWVAWFTGVILLGIVWAEGILGYLMVWDDRAQFVALTTTEFLNVVPMFGAALPRAFLSRGSVTNLFFFVIIALHIGLPILMLLLLWLHVNRVSKPLITPPRSLMLAALSVLLILCAIKPATSGPRADPAQLPGALPLDWFYLQVYPLLTALTPGLSWTLFAAGALALLAVPWLGRPGRPEPVSLFLRRCNACVKCYHDCPFEAISMRPRTDGRPYDQEAMIHNELCVSCGICLGSCDTAALTLPDHSLIGIRAEMKQEFSRSLPDGPKPDILVFVCEKTVPGVKIRDERPWLHAIGIPCIGAVHPILAEEALKFGAAGIFFIACPEGDCHYRTGNTLLEERLSGKREPSLRKSTDLDRIRMSYYSAVQADEAIRDIEQFRQELLGGKEKAVQSPSRGVQMNRWMDRVGGAALLALPYLLIYFFSGWPSYSFYGEKESVLLLSLRHTAAPRACRELTSEEMNRLPPHMRTSLECTRERWPISLRLEIDGEERLAETYAPGGLWSDGPAYVYEKFKVEPGARRIRLVLHEAETTTEMIRSERIEIRPGQVLVLP